MLTQAQIALLKRLFCRLCHEVNAIRGACSLEKEDHSPVTVADFYVQTVLTDTLRRNFPNWGLLAEENFDDLERSPEIRAQVAELVGGLSMPALAQKPWDPSAPYWVLDPIDGTKGFLRKEQYAIALALIERGEVVFGLLGCPRLDLHNPLKPATVGSLLYASKGKGAFQLQIDGTKEVPLQVSKEDDLHRAILCESVEPNHTSHDASISLRKRLQIEAEPLRIDSQCKYALVASGKATVYLRTPTSSEYREKVWDHAAGSLLIEEAGGKVTDLDGKPLDFSVGLTLAHNRGIFASNGEFDAAPFA